MSDCYVRIRVIDGNWSGLMDIPEWTYIVTKKHRVKGAPLAPESMWDSFNAVYELDFLRALADYDSVIEDILKSKDWL